MLDTLDDWCILVRMSISQQIASQIACFMRWITPKHYAVAVIPVRSTYRK